MVNTGQCPHCFATNSFNSTDCLDCKRALPWAAAVTDLQKQVEAAKAVSAQNQQAQQQNSQAQIRDNIAQSQAARAQRATNNSGNPSVGVPPGEPLRVNVFHIFADAFVGRFAVSLEYMDKAGAAWFGLFCMVVSNICIVIGIRMIAHNVTEFMHTLFPFTTQTTPSLNPFAPPTAGSPSPDPNAIPGADQMLSLWKLMVVAFTPWLSIALSCTLARKLFGGEERHLEGDVFIAGVTLLPFSVVILAAGALGYANWEIVAALSVFALTYSVLMLYRGLTTVSAVRDMAAALCVPLVIMSSAYLSKIVFVRLLTL